MDKKEYSLSQGMNFGQGGIVGEEIDGFYYRDSMRDLFNDAWFIATAFQATNCPESLANNPEYEAFLKSEEFENMTYDEGMRRRLDFLSEEKLQELKDYMNKIFHTYEETIKVVEKLYKKIRKSCEGYKPSFVANKDSLTSKKILLHLIPLPKDMDEIKSRKELGFLASEWFGKLEAGYEARFCCCFFKKDGLREVQREGLCMNKKFDYVQSPPRLEFVFDAEDEKIKQLLRLDMFEYLRRKESGEVFKNTKAERDVLELLQDWSSSAKYAALRNLDWVAIPGGVPSNLVVAIRCRNIQNESPEMEIAKQVAKEFEVPLFNEEMECLSSPKDKEQGME